MCNVERNFKRQEIVMRRAENSSKEEKEDISYNLADGGNRFALRLPPGLRILEDAHTEGSLPASEITSGVWPNNNKTGSQY